MPYLQHTVGAVGILLLWLALHLLSGLFFPSRPARKPYFGAIMESAARDLTRRLNRAGRTPSDLFMRGIVACGILGMSAFVIGYTVDHIARYPYGWCAALVFLTLNISALGFLRMMRQAAEKIDAQDVKKAALCVQPFAQDDLSKADAFTVARRALEASATSLNDFFLAPIFWFFILKSPGLAVYAALGAFSRTTWADSGKNPPFLRFARLAAKALDFIPARLTTFFIVIAALFVSKSNPLRAFRTALAQARNVVPQDHGLLIAALAGGLGITLGGPIKHNDGSTTAHGWVGPASASAKVTVQDLRRGALLHFIVFLCLLAAVLVLFAASFRFS